MAGGTGMAKNNLTGLWHGLYSYPAYLEPVFFVATLYTSGQSFSGTTHEAFIGRKGAPLTLYATVSGGQSGGEISFAKTYDGTHGWKHNVAYEGELSADGSEIEGRWTIPGNWSGRFLMIRSAGMSEQVIREAYEKV
jgi:hypothetical protein